MPPLNVILEQICHLRGGGQAHMWWPLGISLFTSLLTLAVLIRRAIIFLKRDHNEHSPAVATGREEAPARTPGYHDVRDCDYDVAGNYNRHEPWFGEPLD